MVFTFLSGCLKHACIFICDGDPVLPAKPKYLLSDHFQKRFGSLVFGQQVLPVLHPKYDF